MRTSWADGAYWLVGTSWANGAYWLVLTSGVCVEKC